MESSKEYLAENKKNKDIEETEIEVLKISVRNLEKDDIFERNLPKNTTGVVVTKISNDSPLKFLSVNDVLVELQKKKITNSNQFFKLVKDTIDKGEKTLMFATYDASNQRGYLTVKLK